MMAPHVRADAECQDQDHKDRGGGVCQCLVLTVYLKVPDLDRQCLCRAERVEGAGGIGLILNEKISWREFHKVGTILLLLFLTVCVIESANRYFTAVIHSGQIAELFSGRKEEKT